MSSMRCLTSQSLGMDPSVLVGSVTSTYVKCVVMETPERCDVRRSSGMTASMSYGCATPYLREGEEGSERERERERQTERQRDRDRDRETERDMSE